jgi:diketogulonate reductase-like aldo/keto reductase
MKYLSGCTRRKRRGAVSACERSLRRLGTDHLDLYLLHWRGRIPLAETVAAFETLRSSGKIRDWGVSNFDRKDMEELLALPDGRRCAVNQVLYHCDVRHRMGVIAFSAGFAVPAYSPLDEGRLPKNRQLVTIAAMRP